MAYIFYDFCFLKVRLVIEKQNILNTFWHLCSLTFADFSWTSNSSNLFPVLHEALPCPLDSIHQETEAPSWIQTESSGPRQFSTSWASGVDGHPSLDQRLNFLPVSLSFSFFFKEIWGWKYPDPNILTFSLCPFCSPYCSDMVAIHLLLFLPS